MKAIKTAYFAMLCGIVLSTTYQCAAPKAIAPTTTFENQTPFHIKSVYFQEWYAGIEVGGTGYSIYIPIVNKKENVQLENAYFRNMEGPLVRKDGRYIVNFKNPAKHYTFTKPEKPADYPFDLNDDECVITYRDNGELKYYKLIRMDEVAGAYYEHGTPSVYDNRSSSTLATLDTEDSN